MEEKKREILFCGKGYQRQDWCIGLDICLSDIPGEYIREFKGKSYVKIDAIKRKTIGEKGDTHYLKINTWKPEPKEQKRQKSEEPEENLPF